MRVLIVDENLARAGLVARAMRRMRHDCAVVTLDAISEDTSTFVSFDAALVSIGRDGRSGIDLAQCIATDLGIAVAFIADDFHTDAYLAHARALGPVLPASWTISDLTRLVSELAARPVARGLRRRGAEGTPRWGQRVVDVMLSNWWQVLAMCDGRAFLYVSSDELAVGTVLTLSLDLPSDILVEIPARIAFVDHAEASGPRAYIEPDISPALRQKLAALARREQNL